MNTRQLICWVLLGWVGFSGLSSAVDHYGYASVSVNFFGTDSSFNSTGGAVSIQKTGLGQGTVVVTFEDIFAQGHGHVQVSTRGAGTHFCNVRQWARVNVPVEGTAVTVNCFDSRGTPVHSMEFDLLLIADNAFENARGLAYTLSSSSAEPVGSFTFNGRNADRDKVQVRRVAQGTYDLTFRNLAQEISLSSERSFGNVQVTGFGELPINCALLNWRQAERESNDLVVSVQCVDTDGFSRDFRFGVLVVHPSGLARLQKGYTRSRNSNAPPLPVPREYAYNSVENGVVGSEDVDTRVFRPFGLGPRPTIVLTTAIRPRNTPGWCRALIRNKRNNSAAIPLEEELVYDPLCVGRGGLDSDFGYSVLALTGETLPWTSLPRRVSLKVDQVKPLAGDGGCGDEVELFIRATLNGVTSVSLDTERREVKAKSGEVKMPNWQTPTVTAVGSTFTASMELWENDAFGCGGDDRFDIRPAPGTKMNLTFDLSKRLVFDDRRVLAELVSGLERIQVQGMDGNPAWMEFRVEMIPNLRYR